ncbi:MAG TPA: beta-N-acetylhexosaminidase [Gammaproteobacteria bacterium]|nr:beta-N-acetylhexosaminidase [Gammaproteobacteria bacterium]
MSLGPLMTGIAGLTLTAEEREWLQHPLVGGVILFARNYAGPEQLRCLVAAIHGLRRPHLLVAVDQEGGRVQRFRDDFVPLPPVRRLGRLFDAHPKRARRAAELTGWLMAAELRACGVDLSFAPVLDLDRGTSEVIGDRAFHGDPEIVADLAHAYMMGMHLAGMAAVGKHFPGHGTAAADSHVAVVTDSRPFSEIETEDLVPFERMIHYGVPALMAAHVIYPAVDALPAGFSPRWVGDILRRRLGFQGAVFSDDLGMAGASGAGDMVERAAAALDGGCDMVLLCNELEEVPALLDALPVPAAPATQLRLTRLHGRGGVDHAHLRLDPAWREAVQRIDEYNRLSDPDLM